MFRSSRYHRSCWRPNLSKNLEASLNRYPRNFQTLQRPFNILFCGRDQFSCLVLQELYAARDVWEAISIVTYPDRKTGRRGTVLSISPLKLLGQSLDISVHTIPPEKREFKFWKPPVTFSQPFPHHLLISASFGRIFPSSVLRLFAPRRCLNVHPSLLPAYRGAAPIQHALINGEKETGVCVIEMMEGGSIDAGGVFGSGRISVPEDAMFVSLRDTLAKNGGKLLVSVLREILTGNARFIPQQAALSSPRAPAITAIDSIIDFTIMNAEEIVRRYRAISHQRPLTTYMPTHKALQLHSPSVFHTAVPTLSFTTGFATYHAPSRALIVRCADHSVLSVPQVKQESRALMDAKEWWNGVKSMGLVNDGGMRFIRYSG